MNFIVGRKGRRESARLSLCEISMLTAIATFYFLPNWVTGWFVNFVLVVYILGAVEFVMMLFPSAFGLSFQN